MTGFCDRQARPKRLNTAGFTLIEVLVAFVVLALVMVVVQRGILTAVGGTMSASTRIGAETVARSLMTAPLTDGAAAGGLLKGQLDGYDWTIRLEPLKLPFATNVTADGGQPAWIPRRMIVDVFGGRKGTARIRVETIRLVEATLQ